MLINWGMSTCEDCKGRGDRQHRQPATNEDTAEIIKWSNLAITKDWFACTATAMFSQ